MSYGAVVVREHADSAAEGADTKQRAVRHELEIRLQLLTQCPQHRKDPRASHMRRKRTMPQDDVEVISVGAGSELKGRDGGVKGPAKTVGHACDECECARVSFKSPELCNGGDTIRAVCSGGSVAVRVFRPAAAGASVRRRPFCPFMSLGRGRLMVKGCC